MFEEKRKKIKFLHFCFFFKKKQFKSNLSDLQGEVRSFQSSVQLANSEETAMYILLLLLYFKSIKHHCSYHNQERLGVDGRYLILRLLGKGGFSEVYKVCFFFLCLFV